MMSSIYSFKRSLKEFKPGDIWIAVIVTTAFYRITNKIEIWRPNGVWVSFVFQFNNEVS